MQLVTLEKISEHIYFYYKNIQSVLKGKHVRIKFKFLFCWKKMFQKYNSLIGFLFQFHIKILQHMKHSVYNATCNIRKSVVFSKQTCILQVFINSLCNFKIKNTFFNIIPNKLIITFNLKKKRFYNSNQILVLSCFYKNLLKINHFLKKI